MKLILKSLVLALSLGAVVAVTGPTGCAGGPFKRSTGEYIDDKAVTERVEDALGDDSVYKYPDVHVNTYKGTAQLTGFVASDEQKSHAEEVAKKVPGVKEIVNNIVVKTPTSP